MREISRQIERSLCIVQNFLKSPSGHDTTKRSGRKRYHDGRIEWQIVRNASNSTMSLGTLASFSKCECFTIHYLEDPKTGLRRFDMEK